MYRRKIDKNLDKYIVRHSLQDLSKVYSDYGRPSEHLKGLPLEHGVYCICIEALLRDIDKI